MRKKKELAYNSIKQIGELIDKGRAKLLTNEGKYYNVFSSKVDEEVIKVAENLKNEGKKVFLLTIDNAQMILAKQKGIETGRNIITSSFEGFFIFCIFILGLLVCIQNQAMGCIIILFGLLAMIGKTIDPQYKIFKPLDKKDDDDFVFGINNSHLSCNVYYSEPINMEED